MSWVAVAIGGSAALGLGGSLYASSQAKDAASVQTQAAGQGAQAQVTALLQAQGMQKDAADKAAAAITGAMPNALQALQGGQGGITSAIGAGTNAINSGATNALAAVQGAGANASGSFSPYINTGNQATYTLANLYGLNSGGQVPANALEMVANSPDYQFAQQQGMNALQNSNAAKGLLNSSEHLRSAETFGQGLATQQFGNYVGRLQALSSQGLSATGSAANIDVGTGNALANIYGGQGTAIAGQNNALASYLASLGINTANLFSGQGNALANVWSNEGNALAGTQTQIGQTQNAGLTGAGQATASGIVGGSNAIMGGIGSVNTAANSYMNYNLLQQILAAKGGVGGNQAVQAPSNSLAYAYGNTGGYTPQSAPLGTGIWPA